MWGLPTIAMRDCGESCAMAEPKLEHRNAAIAADLAPCCRSRGRPGRNRIRVRSRFITRPTGRKGGPSTTGRAGEVHRAAHSRLKLRRQGLKVSPEQCTKGCRAVHSPTAGYFTPGEGPTQHRREAHHALRIGTRTLPPITKRVHRSDARLRAAEPPRRSGPRRCRRRSGSKTRQVTGGRVNLQSHLKAFAASPSATRKTRSCSNMTQDSMDLSP